VSDPQTNARFVDMGGMLTEMMAHQTQLFYDPTTQQVRAIFNGYPYVLGTDGVYRKVGEENDILHVELTPYLSLRPAQGTLMDPITGKDLSEVSVLGTVLIIKAAYDLFFNQRASQLAAEARERAKGASLQGTPSDSDSLHTDADLIEPA
jgi:hypothetical protein